MLKSDSLSSLFKKERLWGNWSRHSVQKSGDSESLFNMSDSLVFLKANCTFALLLSRNEQFARIFCCCFHHVLTVFHFFSPFYAQERITPVALCSVALFFKEQIAISLFCSHKTSNSLEKLKSEFLTLLFQSLGFNLEMKRPAIVNLLIYCGIAAVLFHELLIFLRKPFNYIVRGKNQVKLCVTLFF